VIFDAIFNLDAPGLFEVRAESAGSGPLAEWAELHLSLDEMPLLQHSIRMSPLSERIELAHGRYHLRAVVQAASGHVEWIPIGTDPSATHWAEMSFSVRLVPEPASWLLALLAGGCAFGCRTRRRHQTRLRQISSL
jgi:hypothetical protein